MSCAMVTVAGFDHVYHTIEQQVALRGQGNTVQPTLPYRVADPVFRESSRSQEE